MIRDCEFEVFLLHSERKHKIRNNWERKHNNIVPGEAQYV